MDLNEYQARAITTAIYPNRRNNIEYPTLGLAGEAGEICNKVKKIQRDHGGKMPLEMRTNLIKELGDVLWYAALVADELDAYLGDVAQLNIDKLAKRKAEGKLKGEGDER